MTPIDPTILFGQIESSTFLSDTEKRYWLLKLESMDDLQREELSNILKEGEDLPPKKQSPYFFTIIAKAIKALRSTYSTQ